MTGIGEPSRIFPNASAAFASGTATRAISHPSLASDRICATVARTSRVSVFVMLWTETGAPPPTGTPPTRMRRVLLRIFIVEDYYMRDGASASTQFFMNGKPRARASRPRRADSEGKGGETPPYRSSFVWSRITISFSLTTMLYRPSLVSYFPEGATERLESLSIRINCFPSITARVPPTRTNSFPAKDAGTRKRQERYKIPAKNVFRDPHKSSLPDDCNFRHCPVDSEPRFFPRVISAVGSSSRCFVPSGPRRCRRSAPPPPR